MWFDICELESSAYNLQFLVSVKVRLLPGCEKPDAFNHKEISEPRYGVYLRFVGETQEELIFKGDAHKCKLSKDSLVENHQKLCSCGSELTFFLPKQNRVDND